MYDHCISTKSYEVNDYKEHGAKNLITCTQGFDPKLHRPYHSFEEKSGVVFIGHHEKDREQILAALLQLKIPLVLAGIGWSDFALKHKNNLALKYLGTGTFGEGYARTISGALLGIGLLSKIVPEMHTTRTFEIPACGTALVTERNAETSSIFKEDEVIFFDDPAKLADKVADALRDPGGLRQVISKGQDKVRVGGYDYRSILQRIVTDIFK